MQARYYTNVCRVFSINPQTGVAFLSEHLRQHGENEHGKYSTECGPSIFYRTEPPYRELTVQPSMHEIRQEGFVNGDAAMNPSEFDGLSAAMHAVNDFYEREQAKQTVGVGTGQLRP